jgi:hypothetical protein
MKADLTVNLRLNPPGEFPQAWSLQDGFQASCTINKDDWNSVAICRVIVDGEPIKPGQTRRVGLVIAPEDATHHLRATGIFYLRKGSHLVGEATTLP